MKQNARTVSTFRKRPVSTYVFSQRTEILYIVSRTFSVPRTHYVLTRKKAMIFGELALAQLRKHTTNYYPYHFPAYAVCNLSRIIPSSAFGGLLCFPIYQLSLINIKVEIKPAICPRSEARSILGLSPLRRKEKDFIDLLSHHTWLHFEVLQVR